MDSLNGKVIVVIGGTTGIGISASRAFLQAGASVVSIGRNPANVDQARQSLGPGAHVFAADAADPAAAPRAIQEALRRFHGFDGLYHVAGGSGRKMGDGPLHEISDEGWDFTLNLNLTALFYSNRAAAQQLLRQETGGSILNLSSVLGFSPAPHYFSTHAYAAAKAAIIGLTRSAAACYAGRRIRCNVLAPALVETPMAERAVSNPAIMDYIRSKQPLDGGRVGTPADLDAAAVYLMSDAARFVTGQVLAIDGGWSVTEGQYPQSTPDPTLPSNRPPGPSPQP
jgi:NAD(P)-dependent dehydrogenase (short-subunit alcohol dehydrogenase family)